MDMKIYLFHRPLRVLKTMVSRKELKRLRTENRKTDRFLHAQNRTAMPQTEGETILQLAGRLSCSKTYYAYKASN